MWVNEIIPRFRRGTACWTSLLGLGEVIRRQIERKAAESTVGIWEEDEWRTKRGKEGIWFGFWYGTVEGTQLSNSLQVPPYSFNFPFSLKHYMLFFHKNCMVLFRVVLELENSKNCFRYVELLDNPQWFFFNFIVFHCFKKK